MDSTETRSDSSTPAFDSRWLAIFEDRYGSGSYERLLTFFDRPCVTYAQIAERYGVTRERVRQWHLQLRPSAPSAVVAYLIPGAARSKPGTGRRTGAFRWVMAALS